MYRAKCAVQRVSTGHYTVDPLLLLLGDQIKCHEEVLSLQAMFPPKRFDNFSLCLGDAQKI